MRRIRVAHVITRLCKGGAQENTFHTVRMAEHGRFESDLISGPTEGAEGCIEPAIAAAGVDIIRVPHLVREVAPWRDLRALWQLTALFRAGRYDIVHTHTSKAGFVGRLAAVRARVPIIVHTPHGNVFDGYFSRPVTQAFIAMERYAARHTDRIIELTAGGVDEHLRQRIGRREQFDVVFSGIDLAPYDSARARRQETRRALGIAPGAVLIGAAGRLEPVKGFSLFIEAARQVAAREPGTRFVLAGQGSLEAALRAEAADLGERFQFLGLRDDIPELMAAFDIFVLSSLNEGMGRVLLEAAAAGAPAVAARVGGVPDVVHDGVTGILTPPRDPAALAEALCRLARDGETRRRMGEAARAAVAPHYGLERMVRRIEQLYEALIREKNIDC